MVKNELPSLELNQNLELNPKSPEQVTACKENKAAFDIGYKNLKRTPEESARICKEVQRKQIERDVAAQVAARKERERVVAPYKSGLHVTTTSNGCDWLVLPTVVKSKTP